MELEAGWPCNGPLLRLAEDAAKRLIAAFDTATGMPYGTINLRNGIPPGETTVTCTAGVGTFIIEFGTLSRLTGDPLYEEVALNALKALYHHRSSIGLVGNHVDVMTGRWTAQDAGIGGGVDSYYEYLVKGALLLERPELMSMFHEARATIDRYLKKEDWYVWATMFKGQVTLPVFQSLEAYWPGVLSLIGESDTAMRTLLNYHTIWRQYGFTPEVYNLGAGEASSARESYPLRPELIESIMYLYRQRRDPILLQMGEDILRSIQHSARTSCGYATIKDVRDHKKEDRMESFFLAETTKYLYLLFDPDNFIHNPGVEGKITDTPSGECIVDVGGYIFNTEAHPIDPTMLQCCHEARVGINLTEVHRMHQLLDEEDNIRFMTFIDGTNSKAEKNENDEESVNDKSEDEVEIDSTLGKDKASHPMQEDNNYFGSSSSKLDYMQSVMEKALEARKTIEEFITQKKIDDTNSVKKILDKIATDENLSDDHEKFINAADPINKIDHEVKDCVIEKNHEFSSNSVKNSEKDNEVKEKNNVKEDNDMIVIDNEEKKSSQQAEIKIESKTTYVNLDGSDREQKIPKNISNILSGNVSLTNFSSYLDSVSWSMEKMNISVKKEEQVEKAQPEPPSVVPRDYSTNDNSKSAYRLLPSVIREFLKEDIYLEDKCEPQHLLEKIRRERKYPEHPDIHRYGLLLSPAPSFMERISLAGEFLHKKHLEV